MTKKTGTNFWLGLTIGLLAALLVAALVVLLVPRLRPIITGSRSGKSDNNILRPVFNDAVDNSASLTNTNNEAANGGTDNQEANNASAQSKIKAQVAENIKVTKPVNGDTVSSPLIIKGEARVFESNVSLRVRDGDGTVLATTSTTAEAADIGEFGPFSLSLIFSEPKFSYGSLEIFEVSAKDGSEINKVVVPLNFSK